MKFKYLGDHKEMKLFGHDFSNGATPDVTDPKAIAKLQGNAEFEALGEADKEPAKKEPAKKDPVKGDGDGQGAGGEAAGLTVPAAPEKK